MLAAGLYAPKLAALNGLVFILTRWLLYNFRGLFAFFVKRKGGALNKGRILVTIIGVLSVLANVGIFAYHASKNIKWWMKAVAIDLVLI